MHGPYGSVSVSVQPVFWSSAHFDGTCCTTQCTFLVVKIWYSLVFANYFYKCMFVTSFSSCSVLLLLYYSVTVCDSCVGLSSCQDLPNFWMWMLLSWKRLGLLLKFPENIEHVFCEMCWLHEWITQTIFWHVNCTTLTLSLECWPLYRRNTAPLTFLYFLFCRFIQWLFCMLGLQTYKCCLLLPWKTTEINFTITKELCLNSCAARN